MQYERLVVKYMKQKRSLKEMIDVTMMDIDHFRNYNDTFGHSVDELLKEADIQLYQAKEKGRNCICNF